MGLLWTIAINVVDPLGLWRYLFLQPALGVAGMLGLRQEPTAAATRSAVVAVATAADDAKKGSSSSSGGGGGERSARELAYRATFLAMGAAALIWAAVFMYLTFYYTYMPAVEHVHPVHMQFDACNHDATYSSIPPTPDAHCEFPHAFVRLDGAGQSRMRLGQSYKIHLLIDMPDSPRNRDLGMFMVCASMRDERAELLDHACRAVMMAYRSWLVRAIRTWLLSPLYVFQLRSEQQRVEVQLFDAYGLDQRGPVRDVYLELQSRNIQFYNVTLHVVAHFSGLRYAMWQWPLLSACVGIATNLMFIVGALALSYYNWAHVLRFEQSVRQRLWLPGRRRRAVVVVDKVSADVDGKQKAIVEAEELDDVQLQKKQNTVDSDALAVIGGSGVDVLDGSDDEGGGGSDLDENDGAERVIELGSAAERPAENKLRQRTKAIAAK